MIMKTKREYYKFQGKKDKETDKGKPIRVTPEFSMETLKAKRIWKGVHTLKD